MPAASRRPSPFATALASRVTTKADREKAGAALGVGGEAIRLYTVGDREPSPQQVFKLERHFKLAPGTLSRHLGYLPVEAQPAMSVEDAVAADPRLDDDGRRYLLAVYRAALGRG